MKSCRIVGGTLQGPWHRDERRSDTVSAPVVPDLYIDSRLPRLANRNPFDTRAPSMKAELTNLLARLKPR